MNDEEQLKALRTRKEQLILEIKDLEEIEQTLVFPKLVDLPFPIDVSDILELAESYRDSVNENGFASVRNNRDWDTLALTTILKFAFPDTNFYKWAMRHEL